MLVSQAYHANSSGNGLAEEELKLTMEEVTIFMVWTQAQRLRKEQEFTWDYFSDLMGVPTNTLKTRYRSALKSLGEGLMAKAAE